MSGIEEISHAGNGIAVMYHYVRSSTTKALSGIRPLSIDDFEEQLDWLSERFNIITPEQFGEYLRGHSVPDRPFCLLTFDDGTKDHAQVVTPILARRGLSGLFFLLSGPWVDAKLPISHSVHILLSTLGEERLWNAIYSKASAELGSNDGPAALGTLENASRIYSYEDSYFRKRIKYAINFALPVTLSEHILRGLISEELQDEKALIEEWFVTPEEARDMEGAGMVIGAHGHSHISSTQLSPTQMEAEVLKCHETLTRVLEQQPRWFAYPFGGSKGTMDILEHCDQILMSLGYIATFLYGSSPDPWLTIRPNCFGRFDRLDCVNLPPRSSFALPT
jgi:peptidoglycan/xylan/chitin deacetylase (PgdA/CDA1 family)